MARAFGALVAGFILLGAAAGQAGCGGAATEAPANPFGTPPAPAPGIHAWAAGEVGTLLVTSDGGANWRRQRFYLSERALDVAFCDQRSGWLITNGGAVLATADGGAAWKVVGKQELGMKALAASDSRHAWIVAREADDTGGPQKAVVLRTSDGGNTWSRSGFGDAQLADVAFADARHGVVIALDRIWTTRDGGRTWRLRRQLDMTVLTSVVAGDSGHAWVAGWGTLDGVPLVYATEDGGLRWRRLRVDVPPPAAGALQAGQIAAAGLSRLWVTCNVGILATQDGGETWRLQKTPAGQPRAIAASDERHVLATTSGQPVLATSDGGATWLAFGQAGYLRQPLVAIAVAGPRDASPAAAPASQ